jgi:DNA-directed RNA polymerase subunit alpha
LRRYNESIAEFDAAVQQGWDRVDAELQKAETLAAAGQIDAGAAIVQQHTQLDDSSAQWHYVRGRVAEALGDTDNAIEGYQRSLDFDEDSPHAMFRLAYLLDLHGDDSGALQLYQQCASLPYVHANALINLAVIYEDRGDYERAARCLRRVLVTNSNHPRAQLYLKDVLAAKSMFFDEQQAKVQEQHDAVLDTPVTDFELSVRSRNCLKKMNIYTLGDLLRISERELLAYKNFGETSLNEIKAMLTQKGLALGQYATERPAATTQRPALAASAAPNGNPEILARPVTNLELSVRSRKCLQRLGISTIGELAATSESELLASKNFGQTSLSEIKSRLGEMGLSLRPSQ